MVVEEYNTTLEEILSPLCQVNAEKEYTQEQVSTFNFINSHATATQKICTKRMIYKNGNLYIF